MRGLKYFFAVYGYCVKNYKRFSMGRAVRSPIHFRIQLKNKRSKRWKINYMKLYSFSKAKRYMINFSNCLGKNTNRLGESGERFQSQHSPNMNWRKSASFSAFRESNSQKKERFRYMHLKSKSKIRGLVRYL